MASYVLPASERYRHLNGLSKLLNCGDFMWVIRHAHKGYIGGRSELPMHGTLNEYSPEDTVPLVTLHNDGLYESDAPEADGSLKIWREPNLRQRFNRAQGSSSE